MNTDVKIKHFRETSIQQARNLAEDQVEAHQQAMAQMEVEHKIAKKKSAELTLKTESENTRREMSRVLSVSSLELKHSISRKQLELKDQLFEEVKQRLEAFRKTPEYNTYLLEKIHEAIAFAEKDELHIYLSPEDTGRLNALKSKCDFPLELAEESFGGGILAAIPKRNVQINNTFKNSLKAVYKEFSFQGGSSL